MRYVVLAAGFDGTLARDGRCDRRSIAALRALAASGRKLILVTSRELRDLLDVFPEARLFDYLVAENGAVIHKPAARESAILAPAPSEVLIHELRRRQIEPLSIGSVLVTTSKAHREVLAEMVERLRLDCYIVDNGDSLAVLPAGVNKASGVHHVLAELELSHHNLVAIGDAENDVALLELAEHSVAVANAVPMLKRMADRVTRAPYGDAVSELVREVIESDLAGAPTRRSIVLGTRSPQHQVTFSPAQCSVLVSGPIASGKAALLRNLLGQYLAQQYQCCVMGVYPAGSFVDRDDVVVCGDELTSPRVTDVMLSLQQPMQSVVVNIAALRPAARPEFAVELLQRLEQLHTEHGRPHLIVFDQVEALLNADAASICARMKGAALIFVSTQPDRVPAAVRDEVDIVVALGEPAMTLAHIADESIEGAMQVDTGGLEPGHAIVWVRESGTAPFRVELAISPPSARLATSEDDGLSSTQRAADPQHKNNAAAVP